MADSGEFIATARVSFSKTNASVLLDAVRGMAAVVVLLEHWRNLFFVDYKDIPAHRLLLAPLYVVSSAGHQAVVIFFVLSGYLISRSVFRSLDAQQWSWRSYLLHRLSRLWIVLIPGLILCAVWDMIGLHYAHAPALYGGALFNHMTPDVRSVLTWPLWVSNALFLQVVRSRVFGSDGALWSLSYEFWYYILFPLGLFALRRKTRVMPRVICIVLFVAVLVFVGPAITGAFPIWLLGTLLALVPTPGDGFIRRAGSRLRIVAALMYVAVFLMIAKMPSLHYSDYILAVLTFAFLWILLSAKEPSRPSLAERSARELSRFSFTLYVAHTPLATLLVALILGDTRWVPTAAHLLFGFGLLAVLLAYSYGVAAVTEFNTDRWRRGLERRLGWTVDRSTVVTRT